MLKSQQTRSVAPEMDPLRDGNGVDSRRFGAPSGTD